MLQAGRIAGSIPDEVTGFFNWPKPSSRTTALGSTQPLTEMITRNLPGCKGRPARKADLIAICQPTVCKMWGLRCLTILWLSTGCYRDSFTFYPGPWSLPLIYSYQNLVCIFHIPQARCTCTLVTRRWRIPLNFSPSWLSWTCLMAYSRAKLKRNDRYNWKTCIRQLQTYAGFHSKTNSTQCISHAYQIKKKIFIHLNQNCGRAVPRCMCLSRHTSSWHAAQRMLKGHRPFN
jgi:hypothetical protein